MALRRGLRKLAGRAANKALGRDEAPHSRFEPRASARAPKPPTTPEPKPWAGLPRPPKPPDLAEPDSAWPEDKQDLHRRLVANLRQVYDPEIPINIFDLGLVYAVHIEGEGEKVRVELTLTSPACPMGPQIVADATRAIRETEGVVYPRVDLVWEPPWDPSELPEETRLELGFF